MNKNYNIGSVYNVGDSDTLAYRIFQNLYVYKCIRLHVSFNFLPTDANGVVTLSV